MKYLEAFLLAFKMLFYKAFIRGERCFVDHVDK